MLTNTVSAQEYIFRHKVNGVILSEKKIAPQEEEQEPQNYCETVEHRCFISTTENINDFSLNGGWWFPTFDSTEGGFMPSTIDDIINEYNVYLSQFPEYYPSGLEVNAFIDTTEDGRIVLILESENNSLILDPTYVESQGFTVGNSGGVSNLVHIMNRYN
jgi:hypothetical protein